MSTLHHRQGVEKLPSEKRGAARLPGQGRERLEDGRRALNAAVARFETPECNQEARLDSELLLGAREQRLVMHEQLFAAIDHDGRQASAGVSAEAGIELGLAAVALNHAFERLDSCQRLLDEAVAEAFGAGLFGQRGQPLVEAQGRVNGDGRGGGGCRRRILSGRVRDGRARSHLSRVENRKRRQQSQPAHRIY